MKRGRPVSRLRVSLNGKSWVEHTSGLIVTVGGGGTGIVPLFAVAPNIEDEALEPLAATMEA